MKVTKHEQALIHEVMLMAYEQGVEEGKKQALEAMEKAKSNFSHYPQPNSFTTADEWYRESFNGEQQREGETSGKGTGENLDDIWFRLP